LQARLDKAPTPHSITSETALEAVSCTVTRKNPCLDSEPSCTAALMPRTRDGSSLDVKRSNRHGEYCPTCGTIQIASRVSTLHSFLQLLNSPDTHHGRGVAVSEHAVGIRKSEQSIVPTVVGTVRSIPQSNTLYPVPVRTAQHLASNPSTDGLVIFCST